MSTKSKANTTVTEAKAEVVATQNKFDVTVALEAAKSVTPSPRSGALQEFSTNILALFEAAGTPLSVAQVRAAFAANGQELPNKKFADRLWLLAKKGKLEHAGVGMYKLPEAK